MNLRETKGIAFLLSVVVMFVLLGLGLSYLSLARMETRVSTALDEQQEALYNAESGVQNSLAEIMDNSDPDGDGPGNLPPKDIDVDGDWDYSVSYLNNKITSIGTEGRATRTVVAEITMGPWTGGFQVGSIGPASNCSVTTVNGNVDAIGGITSNFTTQVTVNGTETANNASLVIPATDTSPGGGWQSYAPAANRHTDCAWFTLTPPPGVHYVDGTCDINFSATPGANVNFNGSLIVNGSTSIQSIGGSFTITPSGDDPAIVVGNGSLTMSTLTGVNITGLIYSENNITVNTWESWGGHTISGAIVANGAVALNTFARVTVDFDPSLNPPFFSGGSGGAPTIVSWRGHPE